MSIVDAVVLVLAGFVAGGINAVAGGGSLISFPALLAAGYPAVTANVTNTVAIWPGMIGGSLAYRKELSGQRQRFTALGAASILGALAGSVALLASPAQVFERLVPFLILFACALLAVQPRVGRWLRRRRPRGKSPAYSSALLAAQFLAAAYGAYFGAGLGIMMLAILGIFLHDDLQRLNALKGLLALVINGVAVVYFALFGPVAWLAAVIMAVVSWAGGYFGVRVARRLSAARLRGVVLAFGVVVAIRLLF